MMKKSHFESKGKQRGFYIALAVCLIAIGAAVYIGVGNMMRGLNDDETLDLSSPVSQEDWSEPETEDVTKTESNLPVESQEEASSKPQNTESAPPVQINRAPAVSFMFPLEGEVINPYSNGELVKSKTLKEWRTHDGVDLKAPADTPVKAACGGVVEDVAEDGRWGMMVTISHEGGYQTYYCGLKTDTEVSKGQEIKAGDIVGYVGNTAEIEISEESHLHFAMKKDGEWTDPMKLMK